ncbi:unnamed protein product, partial [Rotaria sordida]
MILNTKNNDLYVLDSGNNRILKYSIHNSSEATVIVDNLNSPTAFVMDNNINENLYIVVYNAVSNIYQIVLSSRNSPTAKNRVIKNGTNTKSFGIQLDFELNIYISEWENHRVVKWLAPKYEKYMIVAGNGSSGSEQNQLNYPQGIYVDNNGSLFIADTKNNRIQKWLQNSTIGITVATSIQIPVY